MRKNLVRVASRIGLAEQHRGAWHEAGMKVRRRRAGYLLVGLSTVLIVLGIVLVDMLSALVGGVTVLAGVVGLVAYVALVRRNRARELAATVGS